MFRVMMIIALLPSLALVQAPAAAGRAPAAWCSFDSLPARLIRAIRAVRSAKH
jgi:hypothetical protein